MAYVLFIEESGKLTDVKKDIPPEASTRQRIEAIVRDLRVPLEALDDATADAASTSDDPELHTRLAGMRADYRTVLRFAETLLDSIPKNPDEEPLTQMDPSGPKVDPEAKADPDGGPDLVALNGVLRTCFEWIRKQLGTIQNDEQTPDNVAEAVTQLQDHIEAFMKRSPMAEDRSVGASWAKPWSTDEKARVEKIWNSKLAMLRPFVAAQKNRHPGDIWIGLSRVGSRLLDILSGNIMAGTKTVLSMGRDAVISDLRETLDGALSGLGLEADAAKVEPWFRAFVNAALPGSRFKE